MGLRHAHPRKLLSKMEQLFQLQISLFGLGKTSCSFTQSLHLFHKLYANKSRSRVMNFKEKLTNITCNTRFVAEYLQTIKGTVDDLALIDTHLSDDDLTIFALNGLGSGFKEIYTGIRARDTPVSFEELHDKLVEHEAFLKREESRGGSYVTINNTRTSLGNTNLDMAMDKVIMGRGSLITAITKEESSTTMVTITISFTPMLYVNFVRKMGILPDNAIQPRGSYNNS